VILLIDNYDSFTWNLVQRLGELDPTLEPDRDLLVVRNDRITPDEAAALDGGRGPSHVIISPGPCTPREAGVSSEIMRRFAGEVPVLGVCLGHQCMGDMHGMTVTRHRIQMHGKTSPIWHDGMGVYEGLPNPFTATRYHSLVIVPQTMPEEPEEGEEGWKVSAWTYDGEVRAENPMENRVIMGIRKVWGAGGSLGGGEGGGVGGKGSRANWEGVQYHPESFLTDAGPMLLANFLRMGARPRNAKVPTLGA
jgi:anthranilate synthase/aminodeoxychorismate synthase-like glutamine amidotransferase